MHATTMRGGLQRALLLAAHISCMSKERATIFLRGGAASIPLTVTHFAGADPEDLGFDLRAAGFRVDRASTPTLITLDVEPEEIDTAVGMLRGWGYVVVLVGA